ncbi:hypothetical protein GRF29_164g279220 [Pseudopithomyces chartarum]|uniref:Uncharacterized protein n=1 Tax=Pseudopithomyces chartarum TaxID=1892770 RepID=A0AAN6RF70_9PLEO|nr:hypothetical protein GRF29_164g279220 [Pseudopithomyces chartarum]
MAASLFRDFSFDAPSRLQSSSMHHSMETTSPTTRSPAVFPTRPPTPPPSYDINDLAQALHRQDLRVVVDYKYRPAYEPLTPPSDDDSFANHIPSPLPLSTLRLNSATLRMQRQANVRMQSSAAHAKDIASLVERMIQVRDQCHVCERKSKSLSHPALDDDEDDEGVNMDYVPTAKEEMRAILPFYRAADRTDGTARVCKKPRMRRSTCSLNKLSKRHSR